MNTEPNARSEKRVSPPRVARALWPWRKASAETAQPAPAATPARLRVAYVADTFEGGVSGGTFSAMRFVEALRAEHDVTVLATGGKAGPDRVVLPGLQLPLRAMKANGFTFALPRRRELEATLTGFDVVHLQFPFWASFVALDCARRAGVPVVAAFHVQPENILRNVGLRTPWMSRAIYKLWVNRLYNRADAVVCPTPFAEEMLRRNGLAVPSHVVSNGVSPAIRRLTVARDPRWADAFLVLMVGRLAAEKRHDLMIEALRRSRHRERIRLVIAGAGPQERALRRLARGLPHPPEIGFFSNAAGGPLERLYNTADLLVHCSEVEIEGMAVLEAMSCGLPALVASSPDSAAPRFAVGPEFLFASGDPADLATRVDWLIEHPAELARAREQAHRVSRSYGFDASVARLVDVYRSVVRPPARATG